MRLRKFLKFALSLGFLAISALSSHAAFLTADTVWSGIVNLEEDLLIPRGVTLTVRPGTKIVVYHTDTTKTEPQFWNPDTEIAVEGHLSVEGREGETVSFVPEGGLGWGGIIVAPGGEASFSHAKIAGADEALLVKDSTLTLIETRVEGASRGLVLAGKISLSAEKSLVTDCEIGVLDLAGVGVLPGLKIEKSKDSARLEGKVKAATKPSAPTASLAATPGTREFVGEYTVEGEEAWSGTVIIDGRVTVPPGSMLKILPGAKVLFRKRDTNGDGLGEGELLILGSVRCAGTAKNPVLFASAEAEPAPGDWDKVSIISSEDAKNSFENAFFRHGLMALHAHYSIFAAKNCLFEENMRALQFQESESATVENCVFTGNKQALRFRDSKVKVTGSTLTSNDYALHVFRCDLEFTGNTIDETLLGGVLLKESRAVLKENKLRNNLSPLRQKGEGSYLKFEKNLLSGAVETAVSLSGVEARFDKNTIENAGLDLIGLEGGEVVLRGNVLGASGRDAVHLNSGSGADARCNDFKTASPAVRIHDREDDPALGKVLFEGACD